jgi:hypothetical protein
VCKADSRAEPFLWRRFAEHDELGGAEIGGARLPNDLNRLATDFRLSSFRVCRADSRAEPFLWRRFAERDELGGA